MLALDLPPEEADEYETHMRDAGLCSIWLVAPTTPEERIAAITARGNGFIYYISREGVTGMQQNVAANMEEATAVIRKHTKLPIAVGFGISNPEQARQVAACSDAVVVGSAIVNQIAEHGSHRAARCQRFFVKLIFEIRFMLGPDHDRFDIFLIVDAGNIVLRRQHVLIDQISDRQILRIVANGHHGDNFTAVEIKR